MHMKIRAGVRTDVASLAGRTRFAFKRQRCIGEPVPGLARALCFAGTDQNLDKIEFYALRFQRRLALLLALGG
jgi:hypothetical protein